MSLADVPIATPCIVTAARPGATDLLYGAIGLRRGAVARVLARYPGSNPTFAEVELEGVRLVTVPLSTAVGMQVEIIGEPEVQR